MKRIYSVIFLYMIFMVLVGCGDDSNKHEGKAKTPSGSSVQKGKEYQKVVDDFKSKGFKNIKTEKVEDLVTGWITKDGEVKEVAVSGNVDYSSDEWVSADAEVVIKYHTFKKEPTVSTAKPEGKSNPDVKKPTVESLTVDNCEELAVMLEKKDDFDPAIQQFAKKYAGKTIEFNGYTAAVNNHENRKTRFDYLIYAGDYNKDKISGPNFQLRDVSYTDLHLTGDNIPNTFGVGLNIRIIATVEKYSEASGLFQLKPISIKMR